MVTKLVTNLAVVSVMGLGAYAAHALHAQMPAVKDAILFDPSPTTRESIVPASRVKDGYLQGILHYRHYYQINERHLQSSVILFCHGRRGSIESYEKFLWNLVCRFPNHDLIAFNYTGYGRSAGKCSEKQILLDGEVALEYATSCYKHVVLFGYSLGGSVATHLATSTRDKANPRLLALVLMSTFSSLTDFVDSFARTEIVCKLLAQSTRTTNLPIKTWLKHCKIPVFIAHSKTDEVIAFDHSTTNYAAASQAPLKQFYLLRHKHADCGLQLREGLDKALGDFLIEAYNKKFELATEGYPLLQMPVRSSDVRESKH